jgi:DNA polymerase type B, organellar and viral
MDFVAIDARADGWNDEFIGLAYHSETATGYCEQLDEALAIIRYYGESGHTFIAHNAEQQCALLFYRHNMFFRAQYRNDRFVFGEYHYDRDRKPAKIWDTFQLAGRLSLPDLAEALNLPWYTVPRRLRHVSHEQKLAPCWEHRISNCWECHRKPEKWDWICEAHQKGECYVCWQAQAAKVTYTYMGHYSAFLGGYGIKPKRTLTGAAIALWKMADNPAPAWLRDWGVDRAARAGYIGPRVEAFKLGQVGPVYYADFHMSYPAIMLNTPMPDPEKTYHIKSEHLTNEWIEYEGVTEATVTVPAVYAPPLPVRATGQLLFPVGTFRGWFTNAELRAARERGTRLDGVHQCVYATETIKPFDNFCLGFSNYAEELKRQGSPIAQVLKLILNSLYGSFGMRSTQTSCYQMPLPPGTSVSDWKHHDMRVTEHCILLRKEAHQTFRDKWSNPLWAAQITGYARLRLLEAMEAQGIDLVYVDTDSIMSTRPIVGLGTGIGELEDGGCYQESLIVAPKLYSLTNGTQPDRIRAAGVPKGQAQRYLKRWEATYNHRVGLEEAWSGNLVPGEMTIVNVTRHLELAKRQMVNPVSVYMNVGWSDTQPLQFPALTDN